MKRERERRLWTTGRKMVREKESVVDVEELIAMMMAVLFGSEISKSEIY